MIRAAKNCRIKSLKDGWDEVIQFWRKNADPQLAIMATIIDQGNKKQEVESIRLHKRQSYHDFIEPPDGMTIARSKMIKVRQSPIP